jgi:hypothetical protein
VFSFAPPPVYFITPPARPTSRPWLPPLLMRAFGWLTKSQNLNTHWFHQARTPGSRGGVGPEETVHFLYEPHSWTLNYNTCIFGDGTPITYGEILTAGPIKDVPPLPLGHYI